MNGIMRISITDLCEGETEIMPSHDPLKEGYICEGDASGPTGASQWYDTSAGTDYGHGERYETEETRYLVRTRSLNRLSN
jgi:hypothetical protein